MVLYELSDTLYLKFVCAPLRLPNPPNQISTSLLVSDWSRMIAGWSWDVNLPSDTCLRLANNRNVAPLFRLLYGPETVVTLSAKSVRKTGLYNPPFSNPIFKISFSTMKPRSEEHTSELQSRGQLVCRLLLE